MSAPHYFAVDCIITLAAGVTAVVVNLTPGGNDMVAVLGAMLATVIAVLEARKKDRNLGNTVCVVIGSSFIGSIAPGALFFNAWPHLAERFTWHVWAALGFLVGLIGWSVVLAAIGVIQRRKDAALESLADKWLPGKKPPQ